ncbi:MAG: helix-turn-helix transcriptional regulator [Thermoplasmata archaeon]|nr:helix-turn-helix transcriptional regulator [Thermoplasmata archaeon]
MGSVRRVALALLAVALVVGGATISASARAAGTTDAPHGVTLSANPPSGVAPLPVDLILTIPPNTTVPAVVWSFGDGDVGSGTAIGSTFLAAGDDSVALVVTDSRGEAGRSSLWVNVSAPATTNRSNSTDPRGPNAGAGTGADGGSRVLPGGFLFPWVLGAVVAGGVLAVLGLRWKLRRRSPEPPAPASPPSVAAPPVGPSRAVPVSAAGPDLPTAAAASPSNRLAPRSAGPLAPPAQERQIANRTIRHLADLPRLAPGDIAGPGRTQAGIVAALGAGQSAVSRVLARLERAGVVTATTAHVSGSPRRVKVYELTPRGERLGLALRETATPGAWVAPGTGTPPRRSTRRRPDSGP